MSVVIGFSSKDILMLDCDSINPNKLIHWSITKARELHSSVLINLTSVNKQLTIDQQKLPDSYSVVFGRKMSETKQKFIINEALKDGIVNLKFARMREHTGFITLRINAKTPEKGHPVPFHYIPNGDQTGVMEFLDFWSRFKNVN